MKPAPFDYVRPDNIAEALDLIAEHGSDARILAGGQSLIAMLNMRVATPKLLIDISSMNEEAYIRDNGSRIGIGCATRQSYVQQWQSLDEKLPLLAKAIPWVGHVQTRNRGTICGSIAHADPSSELPLCLVLLGGEVVLRSRHRTRTVSADQFFQGVLQTARADDEMITEVRFPMLPQSTGTAFNEMAIRHGDFAIVAVGAVADADGVTIAIGGSADRPVAKKLPILSDSELKDALNDLAWSLNCDDDIHATATYRRHLIRTLGQRTIKEAMACRS